MSHPADHIHADVTRQTAEGCAVHKTHNPRSHVNERHHIWPKGEGGPTVPENLVVVCATGHNNIHQAIELLHKGGGKAPDWATWRTYAPEERRLAQLGYQRTVQQHL